MFRASQVLVTVASIGALVPLASARQDAPLEPAFQLDVRPFVARHCAACHGAVEPEGGLTLTGFTGAAALRAERETWEYVRERVQYDEMPPATEPRPDPAERQAFLDWLATGLEGAPPGEAGGEPSAPSPTPDPAAISLAQAAASPHSSTRFTAST